MLYVEIKKTLEELCALLVEQSNEISEIKQRVSGLTLSSPKKKGLNGLAEIMGCSKTTANKWFKTGTIRIPSATSILRDDLTFVNLRAKNTHDLTGQKSKDGSHRLGLAG